MDPARLRGEISLDERTGCRLTAKKAIGLLASALVDAGSTCLQARLICSAART